MHKLLTFTFFKVKNFALIILYLDNIGSKIWILLLGFIFKNLIVLSPTFKFLYLISQDFFLKDFKIL